MGLAPLKVGADGSQRVDKLDIEGKLGTTVDKGKELVQMLEEIEATTNRTVTSAVDQLGLVGV